MQRFSVAPWDHREAGVDPNRPLVKAGAIMDTFPVHHGAVSGNSHNSGTFNSITKQVYWTALSVIASVVIWTLSS